LLKIFQLHLDGLKSSTVVSSGQALNSLQLLCVGSSRRALNAIPTNQRAVRPHACERPPTIDFFIHAASDTCALVAEIIFQKCTLQFHV
jgi:hypothetical protein